MNNPKTIPPAPAMQAEVTRLCKPMPDRWRASVKYAIEVLEAEAEIRDNDDTGNKTMKRHTRLLKRMLAASPSLGQPARSVPSYQARVGAWTNACFGEGEATDTVSRVHRFIEEALELAQSLSCSQSEVLQLVEYVYNRPIGDPHQEVGGVMVTLGALCHAAKMNMVDCGERELTRVWANADRIRAKHATKPRFTPLPGSA
ncbi:MAG: hypothetical protein WC617_12625 [Rhodanobacter sp.]|jgi:hypothetical protein